MELAITNTGLGEASTATGPTTPFSPTSREDYWVMVARAIDS
jgi:hypothetical protein